MGKEDDAMYDYLSKPKYFADIFNARYFEGKPVVRETELLEADGRSPLEGMATRYRDIKKCLRNGTRFAILGIEDQSAVDYEMPVRIMEYDCSAYQQQIQMLHDRKKKARAEDGKKPNNWEIKMGAEDRLWPVYTICLYHGKGSWTGPQSLRDMMMFGDDQAWHEKFSDYPIMLVDVEDEELAEKCSTDLKQFMKALAARNDRHKMRKLLKSEEFLNLEPETDRALAVMLDLKTTRKHINAVGNGGVEKVCLAVDEMVNEGREEGREEGEGRKLATLVCRKLRKGKSVEIIADELEEDIAEIQLICEVAKEAAPEYDEEQVFYKVMERKGKALV